MKKPKRTPEDLRVLCTKLITSAKTLNEVTDDFTRSVDAINKTLAGLNVGLVVWRTIQATRNSSIRQVGYAKVDGRWGLAIRTGTTHPLTEADGTVTEGDNFDVAANAVVQVEQVWLFNDAPRWMRIEAASFLEAITDDIADAAMKMSRDLDTAVETLNSWVPFFSTDDNIGNR